MLKKILNIFIRSIRPLRFFLENAHYSFFYAKPSVRHNGRIPRYLMTGENDARAAAKAYREIFPDRVSETIRQADLICSHSFDLLGSGPRQLSGEGSGYHKIDWHSDFKSGHRWNPKTFYRYVRFGKKSGVDVKVPWELSRFQHLTLLGKAYALTGNKKYQDEFTDQISDWIESNRFPFGVNWVCAMDVAIRAVNWLAAMEFFDADSMPAGFIGKFYGSLQQHGLFICRHLERGAVTTNHYLSDLAGLFFISVYCPEFAESAAWRDFSIKELRTEIEKQVYEDGCSFEASTSYHRLALEILFYCELLGARAGVDFGPTYRQKVRKMFDFSLYCIKPNGHIPQIGDNDSGRFISLSRRPVLDHAYLLSFASCHYKDPHFKPADTGFDEEAMWLFGPCGHDAYRSLAVRTEPLASRPFPDAGWYILRHDRDYCFVVCGPNGLNGLGGHTHNDKLSFELMLDGEDVVVDPGTYVYTSDPMWRRAFRKTSSHNTVSIGGLEQNDISRDLFYVKSGVETKLIRFDESSEAIRFSGEVRYLGTEVIHRREVLLWKNGGGLEVRDTVKGADNATAALCLGAAAEKCVFDGPHVTQEKGWYSKEYGIKEQTARLVMAVGSEPLRIHRVLTNAGKNQSAS